MLFRSFAAIAAMGILAAAPASAGVAAYTTLNISGQVLQLNGDPTPTGYTLADTVTASFTYDPANSDESSSDIGVYWWNTNSGGPSGNGLKDFSITVGPTTWTPDNSGVFILGVFINDSSEFAGFYAALATDAVFSEGESDLSDSSQIFLGGLGLNLAELEGSYFDFLVGNIGTFDFGDGEGSEEGDRRVARQSLVPRVGEAFGTFGAGSVVPEPATWALMIAGFGLVGSALRRRRAAFA
jgi:hypothetical protein